MYKYFFTCSFDVSGINDVNSTLLAFNYVCNGEESDLSSCHLSTGKVCSQIKNPNSTIRSDIAIECDSK